MKNPPAILVEGVLSADLAAVSDLAAEIWRECYSELLGAKQVEYMLRWMYAPDRLRDEVENQGVEYFWLRLPATAGESGRPPCGFLAFGPGEAEDEVFLHKLYVHSSQRGRGIGAAGLAWLSRQADRGQRHRFCKIRLRVNRANHRAIAAYRRAGFASVAEVCSDIGGGFVMDDIVMVKVVGD